ncbi:MAG: hypothetical protein AAF797_07485 [Planctomycetota bacterium]
MEILLTFLALLCFAVVGGIATHLWQHRIHRRHETYIRDVAERFSSGLVPGGVLRTDVKIPKLPVRIRRYAKLTPFVDFADPDDSNKRLIFFRYAETGADNPAIDGKIGILYATFILMPNFGQVDENYAYVRDFIFRSSKQRRLDQLSFSSQEIAMNNRLMNCKYITYTKRHRDNFFMLANTDHREGYEEVFQLIEELWDST